MPEFRERIKSRLHQEESPAVTDAWNDILRDIMFSAVNEDCRQAAQEKISLKTAGFQDAQLRVLAADLARLPEEEKSLLTLSLPQRTRERLKYYENHPETEIYRDFL
jgi:hypothetical protein